MLGCRRGSVSGDFLKHVCCNSVPSLRAQGRAAGATAQQSRWAGPKVQARAGTARRSARAVGPGGRLSARAVGSLGRRGLSTELALGCVLLGRVGLLGLVWVRHKVLARRSCEM